MSAQHLTVRTACVATPATTGDRWVFENIDDVIRRTERWEVDTLGRTLLMEVAPIFVARREPVSGPFAFTERTGDIADIAEGFIIPMKRLPGDSEAIAVRLAKGGSLHPSVVSLYEAQKGEFMLSPMPQGCDRKLKIDGAARDSLWLRATPTVQCDDGAIRTLAQRLKGRRDDVCGVVRELNSYVFRNIEKRNVATFSSALETLKAGFGDCGEHAVLLTALLRASGVASRVVYGLVFVGPKGGYMYHAWVQVFAGEWVNADPAMGTFPAWEGYVPLIVDDTGENTIFLANLIDRVTIRYVPRAAQ
jgi:transglutaminase-like putative cysteine protease